jgi:tetratricopeptide (TPR) repeat protein
MQELGGLYVERGIWSAARDVLTRLAAARNASSPSDPMEQLQLAEVQLRLGDVDAAAKITRQVACEPGAIASEVAASLRRLAHRFVEIGRYTEAIATLEPLDLPEADSRMLARLYVRAGRYASAQTIYQQIISRREQAAGADDPDLADCAEELGQLYERQAKYGPAEAMYKLALSVREKTLGANHPDVGHSATMLADLYNIQGRFAESAALSAMAAEIRQRAIDGTNSPSTVSQK